MTDATLDERQETDLLAVEGLSTQFVLNRGLAVLGRRPRVVHAVSDVSFRVAQGETYALVGESGSGKTTTGRAILRLAPVSGGQVLFQGEDVRTLGEKELRRVRRRIQMVFQDPYSSLNPRIRIGAALQEPLAIHGTVAKQDRTEHVLAALDRVGLRAEHFHRYPHEFSGGQRQRIGLARALVVDPRLVICDEPVSALDVSTQAQVLNLMRTLQADLGLSYLFISHDMSVVRYVADRIGVMYLGKLVEEAPSSSLFAAPSHPYTQALLSAVPQPSPGARRERIVLSGEMPAPDDAPAGCVFASRCPQAMQRCVEEQPRQVRVGTGHRAACHLLE